MERVSWVSGEGEWGGGSGVIGEGEWGERRGNAWPSQSLSVQNSA